MARIQHPFGFTSNKKTTISRGIFQEFPILSYHSPIKTSKIQQIRILKKSPSNPPLSSQKSQGPQDLNPTPLSILGESQLPGPTVYRQDFPLCHMALRRLLETTNSGKFIGKPIGKVM